jgi:dinuclear metal center YbgI/SA1388 family protein
MIQRDELIKFIYEAIGKEWMEKAEKIDEAANGVQILGQEKVEKVALGVSLNEEFLLRAVEAGSNFCIFHHGFNPRTHKSRIPEFSQKRLKIIFENGITVVGFHYVLDAHPEIGNNATIIKRLGAERGESLFEDWGYVARFSELQDVKELYQKCAELFNHKIFAIFSGPEKVRIIGVASGGAKPYAQHLAEMEEKGIELFITGEAFESAPHKMKESGINYFVCGHYATEVFGIQELAKLIRKKFPNLKVEFIDIPNPI